MDCHQYICCKWTSVFSHFLHCFKQDPNISIESSLYMLRITKQNVLDSRKLPCNLISMLIGPAFAHGNLTLTKKMQSTLSIPKLFLTHGSGQFALIVSPLVPFQWPKIQTMISVEMNLAMFWAPSTDAEGLQSKQFCRWLILYLLNNHT